MAAIDKILELVKESGLTAKEFAEGANIAGGSITDWKTGRSKPSVESLQKIAKYANVQLEWLTGDSEFKTKEELQKYYDYMIGKSIISQALIDTVDNFLLLGLSQEEIFKIRDMLTPTKDIDMDEKKQEIFSLLSSYPKNIREKLKEAMMELLQRNYELLSIEEAKSLRKEISQFYMCPVYGRISAGQPNWAEECIEGRIPIDPDLMNIVDPEECYFLHVNGESMNKIVKNGGFALIRKTAWVENGEIAVVLVNGFDATLKKFSKQGDLAILEPMSDDPNFTTQVYGNDTEIKIIGKYIGKMEINR